MLVIDWTLSIGNILTALGFIGAGLTMFFSMKSDISVLREDVRDLEKGFERLGNILTQVAVQDNRLHMLEKAIDELRHGQGYILATKEK